MLAPAKTTDLRPLKITGPLETLLMLNAIQKFLSQTNFCVKNVWFFLQNPVCKITKTCGGYPSARNPCKEQCAVYSMMFPNQFCGWILNRRRSDRESYNWKKLQKQFVNLQKQNYKNWFRLDKVCWSLRYHGHSKEHPHAVPPRWYDPFILMVWSVFLWFSILQDSSVNFL